MDKHLNKIAPKVSDIWKAYELWMKFKVDRKCVLVIMDDETRFCIAQDVAETKFKHDVRKLFHLDKKVTGKSP